MALVSVDGGFNGMSAAATLARKRRREKLASSRCSPSLCIEEKNQDEDHTLKKHKLTKTNEIIRDSSEEIVTEVTEVTDEESLDEAASSPGAREDTKSSKRKGPKVKKLQLRYDPEVPMSKEDATAWRREQRRKRNRESAAASRQKQRDRISQLEDEVSEWREKFDQAMKRIAVLERELEGDGSGGVQSSSSLFGQQQESAVKTFVSPCVSPQLSPKQMPPQVPSSPRDESARAVYPSPEDLTGKEQSPQNENSQFHLNKISRPA